MSSTERPDFGAGNSPLSDLKDDIMTEGTVPRQVMISAIGGLITAYTVAKLIGGR